jgi:hypothetical protein
MFSANDAQNIDELMDELRTRTAVAEVAVAIRRGPAGGDTSA